MHFSSFRVLQTKETKTNFFSLNPHRVNELTINEKKVFNSFEKSQEIKSFWLKNLQECLKPKKEHQFFKENNKKKLLNYEIREMCTNSRCQNKEKICKCLDKLPFFKEKEKNSLEQFRNRPLENEGSLLIFPEKLYKLKKKKYF